MFGIHAKPSRLALTYWNSNTFHLLKNKTQEIHMCQKLNSNFYFTERQWTKEYLTIMCYNTKNGKHDDRNRYEEKRHQTKST